MSLADDRILEYLSEEEVEAGSPAEIREKANITFYSKNHISRRLRDLEDKGFVVRIAAPAVYRISERGQAYLDAEYDASVHDNDKYVHDDEKDTEADGGVSAAA